MLAIVAQTGGHRRVFGRLERIENGEAATLARVSIATASTTASVNDIVADIREQVLVLLPR